MPKRSQQVAPVTEQRERIRVEAETVPGLEMSAWQEISSRFRKRARLVGSVLSGSGAVQFDYGGDLKQLASLKSVQAVYLVMRFDVPRPKALLSNNAMPKIIASIQRVISESVGEQYVTLYIGAAGSDSAVFKRFASELEAATGLVQMQEQGDLWLRVRPTADRTGWEVLVRIGARPLATRAWRLCNYEGALNATVAYAMATMSAPTDDDRIINLGSGSGTLLIERAGAGSAAILAGVDSSGTALNCAATNLGAAGTTAALSLADMTRTPFPDQSFDVLLADLPFGQLSGTHAQNRQLYPAAISEAARIAMPGARMVVITHEVRLIEATFAQSDAWRIEAATRITLRGLHPRIYVASRC